MHGCVIVKPIKIIDFKECLGTSGEEKRKANLTI